MRRRGFLRGLLAAPVVITTPGLLMPVVAHPLIWGPNGILTVEMIGRETARLLARSCSGALIAPRNQASVDLQYSTQDLTLPLQKFSERYCAPAAAALQKAIGLRRIALNVSFPLPPGIPLVSRSNYKGTEVRFICDYDPWNDVMRHRFDVLYG